MASFLQEGKNGEWLDTKVKAKLMSKDDLLSFVCDFREYIKDLGKILDIVVVLGGAEAHEVEEILLVVQGHVQAELFEDGRECMVRNQVQSPIIQLSLTLKAQPVEHLRFDVVALKQLQDTSKQVFLIARVFVEPTAQAVQDNVLLLRCFLQVTDQ